MGDLMAAGAPGTSFLLLNKSSRRILWNVFAIILAAVLITLVMRSANWDAVAGQIRHAQLSMLLFVWIVLGSLACLLRAIRWYVLLSEKKGVSFWPVFWANSSGNLCNGLLPARAGEFIRAAMVSMTSDLNKRFVLAVGLCERIFDMLVLLALTQVGLFYISVLPAPIQHAISTAFWLSVCAVGTLIVASQSHRLAVAVISGRWSSPALRKVWGYIEPFVDGIRSIHSRKRLLLFLALTIPIWLVDAWGAKLVAASLGLALPFPVALILLAAIACSSLLPGIPGQLGIFQFVTIRVLAICHIQYNPALTYSLFLQAGTYLVLAIWGIPGLWMYKKMGTSRELSSLQPVGTPDNAQQAVSS